MTTNVDLRMSFDNVYQPVLTIPVEECQCFSKHPLTWLCYIGFTIYGTEGNISLSLGGPAVEYYEQNITARWQCLAKPSSTRYTK